MQDFIPQWVTDIESDEKIFKKKHRLYSALLLIDLIVFSGLAIFFGNDPTKKNYIFLFFAITFFPLLIRLFENIGPILSNRLAANLYRIGAELESYDPTSPSYVERNLKYLKNCRKIIDKFVIEDDYGFTENYNKFFNNLGELFSRLNCLYLENSKPNNIGSISEDLKRLAEAIHENNKNIEPVHAAYVEGILSNLQNIEPLAPSINRLFKSFISGWYNISYAYRSIITLSGIEIIAFAIMSIVLIYVLGVDKTQSYGIAFGASIALIAGLITQIDKIVPKEKVKFSK